MLSIAAREWMAEGAAKGRAEGEMKGKAEMLLRQLRRRFKSLPSDVEDRVWRRRQRSVGRVERRLGGWQVTG